MLSLNFSSTELKVFGGTDCVCLVETELKMDDETECAKFGVVSNELLPSTEIAGTVSLLSRMVGTAWFGLREEPLSELMTPNDVGRE